MSLIIITTTSDDRAELEKIAASLVESKLAACCQISGPITSVYSWQGKTETASEWTCAIKTQKQLFSDVKSKIIELHHYDLPQVIAVEVAGSSASYREWVFAMTSK